MDDAWITTLNELLFWIASKTDMKISHNYTVPFWVLYKPDDGSYPITTISNKVIKEAEKRGFIEIYGRFGKDCHITYEGRKEAAKIMYDL